MKMPPESTPSQPLVPPETAVDWMRLSLLNDSGPVDPQATLKTALRPPGPGETPAETTPPTEFMPGYDILGEIGRGGMGVVYEAKHLGLNRRVALKMIRGGLRASGEERDRFLSEARTVARLMHPNIVQIYDVGVLDGMPYCALELVTGGSLESRLQHQPQPPREAAKLLAILARAMHGVHEQGIVHRDLKPANILLARKGEGRPAKTTSAPAPTQSQTPSGKSEWWDAPRLVAEERLADFIPKITDFGLAKRTESATQLTASGFIIGTPQYMAPEQASGKNRGIGPAADIHALGVILYEMLTGQLPYVGLTPLDIIMMVQSVEPVPPRHRVPTIPHDLEIICLKCLEKDPDRRYATSAALADDLERWLEERPIQARPVPLWERAVKWAKRSPLMACLMVVTAAVMVILAVSLGHLAAVNVTLSEATLREPSARQEAQERPRPVDTLHQNARGIQEQINARLLEDWLSEKRTEPISLTEKALLTQMLKRYEEVAHRSGSTPEQRLILCQTHARMGLIHFRLGDRIAAETALRRGLEQAVAMHRDDPRRLEVALTLADLNGYLGKFCLVTGRGPEAGQFFTARCAVLERAQDQQAGSGTVLLALARAQRDLGHWYWSEGRREEALRLKRQACEVFMRLQESQWASLLLVREIVDLQNDVVTSVRAMEHSK